MGVCMTGLVVFLGIILANIIGWIILARLTKPFLTRITREGEHHE